MVSGATPRSRRPRALSRQPGLGLHRELTGDRHFGEFQVLRQLGTGRVTLIGITRGTPRPRSPRTCDPGRAPLVRACGPIDPVDEGWHADRGSTERPARPSGGRPPTARQLQRASATPPASAITTAAMAPMPSPWAARRFPMRMDRHPACREGRPDRRAASSGTATAAELERRQGAQAEQVGDIRRRHGGERRDFAHRAAERRRLPRPPESDRLGGRRRGCHGLDDRPGNRRFSRRQLDPQAARLAAHGSGIVGLRAARRYTARGTFRAPPARRRTSPRRTRPRRAPPSLPARTRTSGGRRSAARAPARCAAAATAAALRRAPNARALRSEAPGCDAGIRPGPAARPRISASATRPMPVTSAR